MHIARGACGARPADLQECAIVDGQLAAKHTIEPEDEAKKWEDISSSLIGARVNAAPKVEVPV